MHSLAEWLEIATAKLSSPAQERIRVEIEAHFAESVESHQMAGCAEIEARQAAVAELGDPRAAGKRFGRQHLTKKEAKRVHEILTTSGATALLLVRLAFCALLFVSIPKAIGRGHFALDFVSVGFLVCAVMGSIGFMVARRQGSMFDVRQLVLIQLFFE
jgi:hypothetical protein